MNKLILLKLIGLGVLLIYSFSFIWISLLYLLGHLYYPINESDLKKYFPFEYFVMIISVVIIIGLILVKSRNFIAVLLQNVVILIFAVPFFSSFLNLINFGIDSVENIYIPFTLIVLGSLIIINLNDWLKVKKPVANNA